MEHGYARMESETPRFNGVEVLVPPAGTSFRVPLRETIGYADALGPSLFSGAPPPGPHRRSRDGS